MNLQDAVVPIVILGHNRTMMTIENIRAVLQCLSYKNIRFIIGSDRSEDGHIQALTYFLNTTHKQFDILETSSEKPGLGSIMNMCFAKALEYSDYFIYMENDMILHRDIDISNYINLFSQTQIGAINFKCSSAVKDKYHVQLVEFGQKKYVLPIPSGEDASVANFGISMYSKKFMQQMGEISNDMNTDVAEKQFMKKYNKLFAEQNNQNIFMAFDIDNYHSMMNDKLGLFYHIGINCQHRPGVHWNPTIIPPEYHYLSDDQFDSKFRSIFRN